MARFGITGIIQPGKEQKVIIKQRKVTPSIPTWLGNITLNLNKDSKNILSGKESIHDYFQRLHKNNQIVIIELEGFVINGMITSVNDLYPGFNKYFVAFVKNGYTLYLLTLGSKTVAEFRAAGHDTYLKSRVPLIITLTQNKQFEPVNLKPFLKPFLANINHHDEGVENEDQIG